jgi:hypothetical protein
VLSPVCRLTVTASEDLAAHRAKDAPYAVNLGAKFGEL